MMRLTGIAGLLLSLVACAAEGETDVQSSSAASTDGSDGTPVRTQCTSSFGSGLSTGSYGRLDGTLVAIVAPGTHGCNGDSHHTHLQIAMGGDTYDVAVDVGGRDGVDFAETDAALVGGAWSEGWHPTAKLDYATTLGLHDSAFKSLAQNQLASQVETELAKVNHISIFATKYSKGGIHLVHRSDHGGGSDGALVTNPLGSTAHYMAFSFPRQSF